MSNEDWVDHMKAMARQYSHLLHLDNTKIVISENGNLQGTSLIENSGYFAFYRFTGLLPFEYIVNENSLNKVISEQDNWKIY